MSAKLPFDEVFAHLSPESRAHMRQVVERAKARQIEPSTGPETIGIQVLDKIDDNMLKMVERRLASKPAAREISLVINSRGGFVAPAKKIYDALRAHGAFIRARAVHDCCSAAISVLLAGDDREATSDTRFLLHESSIAPVNGVRWTAALHENIAAVLRDDVKEMAEFYWRCTGYTPEKFLAEIRTEQPMSAVRARDHFGLIHRVLG